MAFLTEYRITECGSYPLLVWVVCQVHQICLEDRECTASSEDLVPNRGFLDAWSLYFESLPSAIDMGLAEVSLVRISDSGSTLR